VCGLTGRTAAGCQRLAPPTQKQQSPLTSAGTAVAHAAGAARLRSALPFQAHGHGVSLCTFPHLHDPPSCSPYKVSNASHVRDTAHDLALQVDFAYSDQQLAADLRMRSMRECILSEERIHSLLKYGQVAKVKGITINNGSNYIAKHESYVLIWILQAWHNQNTQEHSTSCIAHPMTLPLLYATKHGATMETMDQHQQYLMGKNLSNRENPCHMP
jgi:hypothetical protein